MYNVLVTGVGAIIGYGIVESLKTVAKNIRIIGCDIFTVNYGRYLCDYFEKSKLAADKDYIPWLNQVVEKYDINLIIPGIEQDLFSINESRSNVNTTVVLNHSNIINLTKDKLRTIQFIKDNTSLPYIETVTELNFEKCVSVLGLPFIVKPRFSYASKGFYVINNFEEFKRYCLDSPYENLIFQKHIGTIDDEYTVSVFGDGRGTYLDRIILRRYLSKEGATSKAFVIKGDKSIEEFVTEIVRLLKPVGPTNFQFRKQDGVAYLLEINPRISSACSLRTKFGYNDPLYCINFFLERKELEIQEKRMGYAIRYISDHVIYE